MKGRRWILLIIWILSLVAISFYGGAVSYGLFFCVSLLPFISLFYLVCVYARFRIYQEIESRNIICRQPMPYYFVLQNGEKYAFAGISARLFSGLSYVEEMPDDVEYELLPGDRYTFRTRLVCKYRGEYEVGVKEVVVTDFFRIFRLRYKIPGTIKALVYPRIVKKESIQSLQDISAYLCRENQRLQTENDVVVRDYISGDAMKQIHWKASAKEQKLKTRNRTGEQQQGIMLFFDTKRYAKKQQEYLPVENQILETVLALGYFFAQQNISFCVMHSQNGLRRREVEGMQDYDAFYHDMAKVIFDEREDGQMNFVKLTEQGDFWLGKTMIAVLHKIDDNVMDAARKLSYAGQMTILYVVTEEDIEEYIRQGNSRLKIIAVPIEADLEEWL